jgi:hypothetical protein
VLTILAVKNHATTLIAAIAHMRRQAQKRANAFKKENENRKKILADTELAKRAAVTAAETKLFEAANASRREQAKAALDAEREDGAEEKEHLEADISWLCEGLIVRVLYASVEMRSKFASVNSELYYASANTNCNASGTASNLTT